jgi:hypothetical protein
MNIKFVLLATLVNGFSLLFLFVGVGSSAHEVRIDPAYLNDGVYDAEIDAGAARGALYNENIDDPAAIQVLDFGSVPCTRNLPIGVPCMCNSRIINRVPHPGWTMFRSFIYVRPGWHLTNLKGMHAGGNICYRDRDATPAEREQFHRTGH